MGDLILIIQNVSHFISQDSSVCSSVMRHEDSRMCVMSLPWKGPAAQLLYENLATVLNSFDICALSCVMFAPVLFLFH